jgi:hypothetical protein
MSENCARGYAVLALLMVAAAESQPASRSPAPTQPATTRAEPASQPREDPATRPSSDTPLPISPEAMVESLRSAPVHPKEGKQWKLLSAAEKAQAERKYLAALEAWRSKHEFHDLKVTWTLRLDKTAPIEGHPQVTLTGTSEAGYVITAVISPESAEAIKDLRKGAAVRVTGTIKDYNLDDPGPDKSIFQVQTAVAFGALLEDATAEPGKDSDLRPARPAKTTRQPK